MDMVKKQVIVSVMIIALCILFLVIQVPQKVENFIITVSVPFTVRYGGDKTDQISLSIVMGVQLALAALLVVTPLSLVGGVWFMKLFYDLVIGVYKGVNVFVFSSSFNSIIGGLAAAMFIYSIYQQYVWIKKLTHPLPFRSDDKDLTKFI